MHQGLRPILFILHCSCGILSLTGGYKNGAYSRTTPRRTADQRFHQFRGFDPNLSSCSG